MRSSPCAIGATALAIATVAAGVIVNPFLWAAEGAQMRKSPILVQAPHPTVTVVLPIAPGE